jgi:hypothetical protein
MVHSVCLNIETLFTCHIFSNLENYSQYKLSSIVSYSVLASFYVGENCYRVDRVEYFARKIPSIVEKDRQARLV